jgi:hypothetical protein
MVMAIIAHLGFPIHVLVWYFGESFLHSVDDRKHNREALPVEPVDCHGDLSVVESNHLESHSLFVYTIATSHTILDLEVLRKFTGHLELTLGKF